MTTNAFVSGFTVARATTASPASYNAITEVFGLSGLGQTNELIDATHFGSAGNREYIGGLADGQEITIECNYIANDASQEAFVTAVKNKETHAFQVTVTDSSPNVVYTFSGVCLGWVISPAVDDRNTIAFTVKISGDITVV